MKSPVSLFIMDVRNSTGFENPNELTNYLKQVVKWIDQWTNKVTFAKSKNRYGDEIICVCEGLASAFTLASYIKKVWKYENHPPYFGITYGFLEGKVQTIEDVDEWNDPMIKTARIANELIKKEPYSNWLNIRKDRGSRLDDLYLDVISNCIKVHRMVVESQTDQQRAVCSYFSVLKKQSEVSKKINKTPSTVSIHLKNGRCDAIIDIEKIVEDMLFTLENKETDCGEDFIKSRSSLLHESIVTHIKKDWEKFFRSVKSV